MKRTATSSERSFTGVPGHLHLDGRFLEYERGKREGERMIQRRRCRANIYVLRFSLGLDDDK